MRKQPAFTRIWCAKAIIACGLLLSFVVFNVNASTSARHCTAAETEQLFRVNKTCVKQAISYRRALAALHISAIKSASVSLKSIGASNKYRTVVSVRYMLLHVRFKNLKHLLAYPIGQLYFSAALI